MQVYVLFLTFGLALGQTNYCQLFGNGHTMCKYSKNSGCRKLATGIDSSTKVDILNEHNKLRQKVAKGMQKNQPQASNMKEMVWNNGLAEVAQRWADQCTFGHDDKRLTITFNTSVGQNVAYMGSTDARNTKPNFSGDAVKMWFDEVKLFDANSIKPFNFNVNTGHYTQVVWADSFAIGCGFSFYKSGKFYMKLYVCNYGPGGNVQTASMYKIGKPCSKCQCSKKYPGLCS